MGLKEQLMEDYKDAMKNADQIKKETVNLVRAAIKQYEVDKRMQIEDDAEIVKIIKKQVKMRTDALADFAKGGREDLVEAYNREIEVLQKYLPEEMTAEDVSAAIKKVAEDLGITEGMQNMGKLMKACMAELKDSADGGMVNRLVKEYLSDNKEEK